MYISQTSGVLICCGSFSSFLRWKLWSLVFSFSSFFNTCILCYEYPLSTALVAFHVFYSSFSSWKNAKPTKICKNIRKNSHRPCASLLNCCPLLFSSITLSLTQSRCFWALGELVSFLPTVRLGRRQAEGPGTTPPPSALSSQAFLMKARCTCSSSAWLW